ncbi:hypothetical protein HZB88_04530, partial [archaeon]|nr:hypothetical protein [archaeon]
MESEQHILQALEIDKNIEAVLTGEKKDQADALNILVNYILPPKGICPEEHYSYSPLDKFLCKELIRLGIEWHNKYGNSKRDSGHYYFGHPLETGKIVALLPGKDITLIGGALFHDTVENRVEAEEIREEQQVRECIKELKEDITKIIEERGYTGKYDYPRLADQLELIILKITRRFEMSYYRYGNQLLYLEKRGDIAEEKAEARTITIKGADRAHNISDMEGFDIPHKLYSVYKNFFLIQGIGDKIRRFEAAKSSSKHGEYTLREKMGFAHLRLKRATAKAARMIEEELGQQIPASTKDEYKKAIAEYHGLDRITEPGKSI